MDESKQSQPAAVENPVDGAIPKTNLPHFTLGCAAVPIGLSLLLGMIGIALGTDKIDSPGMVWVHSALIFHLPTILVLAIIFPAAPLAAGEDGGFEVFLLFMCMIPSAVLYLAMGWLLDKLRRMAEIGDPAQRNHK